MLKYVFALLLAGTLSGCLHTTYTTGKPRGSGRDWGTNHFFLWGLVNTAEIDTARSCPDGVARVRVYKSFLNGFLEVITLGIYAPRAWDLECSGPPAPAPAAPSPAQGTP